MSKHTLTTAIAALSYSVESMARRINVLDEKISAHRKNHKLFIRNMVSTYLNNFTSDTRANLTKDFPSFMTPSVTEAFTTFQPSLFGLYKPLGTEQALLVLQTKFASFLEEFYENEIQQNACDTLSRIYEKNTLCQRQNEAIQLLRLMKAATTAKTHLPDVLQQVVTDIANRANEVHSQIAQQCKVTSMATPRTIAEDDDLWIQTFTGIPENLRTWAWSSMESAFHPDTNRYPSPDTSSTPGITVDDLTTRVDAVSSSGNPDSVTTSNDTLV